MYKGKEKRGVTVQISGFTGKREVFRGGGRKRFWDLPQDERASSTYEVGDGCLKNKLVISSLVPGKQMHSQMMEGHSSVKHFCKIYQQYVEVSKVKEFAKLAEWREKKY